MKLIAFVEGRPKPQPRVTQNVKFLFSNTVEYWAKVDASNAEKAKLGLLNKKGKPYKETRYAYRLARLQSINEFRANVYDVVCRACNNGQWFDDSRNIPTQNLFYFYLFKIPTRYSKIKRANMAWTIHEFKPDYSNCNKAIDDCLYKNDSMCSHVAHYKLYIPDNYKEGILLLHDEEIHSQIVDIAKDFLLDINK
jgi:hypothetical protein